MSRNEPDTPLKATGGAIWRRPLLRFWISRRIFEVVTSTLNGYGSRRFGRK
jgi:hypothetical protein